MFWIPTAGNPAEEIPVPTEVKMCGARLLPVPIVLPEIEGTATVKEYLAQLVVIVCVAGEVATPD